MDNYGDLLGAIANCPVVAAIRSGACGSTHPCHKIVTSQAGSQFQLPEPWSGQLNVAPILFISSNPSINDSEKYPDQTWGSDRTRDFFHNRFSPNSPWVKRGLYVLQRDDSYGADWVRFWAEARGFCSERYLERVLSASVAKVLVVFGESAKSALVEHFGDAMKPVPNQRNLASFANERMVTFLPHPNERGSKKSLRANLDGEGVLLLRKHLNG